MHHYAMPGALRAVRSLPQGDRDDSVLAQFRTGKTPILVAARAIPLSRIGKGATAFMEAGHLITHLEHPNIVGLKGIIEREGAIWVLTEPVDGPSLRQVLGNRIKTQRKLSPATVIQMVRPVCKALIYGHSEAKDRDGDGLHIPHGSLRPERVLIGSNGRVRVAEYWLGWVEDSLSGCVPAACLTPELARGGPPSALTDQFAVGALLFELCTKEALIQGNNPREARRRLSSGAYRDRLFLLRDFEIPQQLIEVIDACLSVAPQSRFPHMKALSAALARVQRGLEIPPTRVEAQPGRGAEETLKPYASEKTQGVQDVGNDEGISTAEHEASSAVKARYDYATAETGHVGEGVGQGALAADYALDETQPMAEGPGKPWPTAAPPVENWPASAAPAPDPTLPSPEVGDAESVADEGAAMGLDDDEGIEVSGWWEIPDLSASDMPTEWEDEGPLEVDEAFQSDFRRGSLRTFAILALVLGLFALGLYQVLKYASAEEGFRLSRMEVGMGVIPSGIDEARIDHLEALVGVQREGDIALRVDHLQLEWAPILARIEQGLAILEAGRTQSPGTDWPPLPRVIALETQILGHSRPLDKAQLRPLSLNQRVDHLFAVEGGRAMMMHGRLLCDEMVNAQGCSVISMASEGTSEVESEAEGVETQTAHAPTIPYQAPGALQAHDDLLATLSEGAWQRRGARDWVVAQMPSSLESRLYLMAPLHQAATDETAPTTP